VDAQSAVGRRLEFADPLVVPVLEGGKVILIALVLLVRVGMDLMQKL
jgi:hypothetical protein